MNKLSVKILDSDGIGISRITELSLGKIAARSMFIMPHIKSYNEYKILMGLFGRNLLETIEGAVIDVVDAPTILSKRKLQPLEGSQKTMEGRSLRDAESEFRDRAMLLPNPRMEYLYNYRVAYDKKILQGYGHIEQIKDFLAQYNGEIARLKHEDKEANRLRQSIRRRLHNELFFTEEPARIRKRDNMLNALMKMQLSYFPYGVPACPMTLDIADFQHAKDVNDVCQAIAYTKGFGCSSYFLLHKIALKNPAVINSYFDYVSKSSWATLNVVNFFELDLHCPPDIRARRAFGDFKRRMAEIKEEHPEKEFVLFGAGNQMFTALETFDIVSTSMTGYDRMIGFGKSGFGNWFNERLMLPVDIEDRPQIDRNHCPTCYSIAGSDFRDPAIYNNKRKQHRVFDMDKKAREMRDALKSKSVGVYMRQQLSVSEFSGYIEDTILSP